MVEAGFSAYPADDRPPVTKNDIVSGLRALGIRAGDRMFAHTSLSAFGRVDGGADAVCDALVEAVGPSGTVAVPTFTWGAYHDQETVVFDVRNDPCEVGRVPETFRRRAGAVRSEHVCHSIAAIGAAAQDVMGDGVRPFAEGSSMHRLYELDFWYVFLGCGFGCCTALHTVEELAQVPYRYYRHFEGSTVIRADGSVVPARSVEFLRRNPYDNDFGKMEAVYRKEGLLRTVTVGDARILCAKAREIVDLGLRLMRDDIGCLLTEASRQYLAQDQRFETEHTRSES